MDGLIVAKQDVFKRARERIDEAKELARDQHERIREDLRFSNPSMPKQWRDDDLSSRTGRPSLTLDRTNQFIGQVVNDARQNNPGMQIIAVDSKGDPKAAETLGGMIRHIEYQSRASQAYDTALELSARCGMGWLRVIPEVTDAATNEQDACILRVIDPTSCGLDPNSIEPDGRDAMWGYAETRMHERAFKAAYPKAKPIAFDDGGWYSDDYVTVCEYFEIEEEEENRIIAINAEGFRETLSEDEYWRMAEEAGAPMMVLGTAKSTTRRVKWTKMTGAEILEETYFPSQYIPIVPVLGYELWVDGKRYVCGLTRRLMDGQRLHNYQMSAMAEFLSTQPKAPFIVPAEGVAGWENEWKKLNKGNPSFLPYNSVDDQGNTIPAPSRLAPPMMPGAYAQMAQFATAEMEAAVGMFKANLGQQGNETSGKAIRARQMEGDTATFHFIDNLGRSIEQLGRIVLDMIPRLYDTARVRQVMGIDGERDQVKIKPDMPNAVEADPKGKVLAINPNIGKYDVRVKAGPSYTSQREETAQQLADMIQAQPQLAPVLGPMWARLKDMPESDKISKLLLAMAPPQVQQIESEDDIPPAALAKIQMLEQQSQQMGELMQQAADRIAELESEEKKTQLEYLAKSAQIENDMYAKITDRIKAMQTGMTPEQVQALVIQVLSQAASASPEGGEELEQVVEYGSDVEGMQEPPGEMEAEQQGPTGPFSLPEGAE